MKEIYTITFDGTIWGQKHDPVSNNLSLEIRNADKHLVQYEIINLESGKHIGTINPDNWWTSQEHLSKDQLLLTSFEEEGNAKKKDLFSYATKGSLNWKKENTVIINEAQSGLILDCDSKEETLNLPTAASTIQFPIHYVDTDAHFLTVKDFIQDTTKDTIILGCDYIETTEHLLISYFIDKGDNLCNYLLITNLEGSPIHKELLGEKLSGIAFDTFYIANNMLYCIINKNEFKSIQL